MKISANHLFQQTIAKSYKLFAIALLIVLCILSSCAVRKGIHSFLSGQTFEYSASGKKGSSFSTYKQGFAIDFTGCKTLASKEDIIQSLSKISAFGKNIIPVLFLILPVFLISLLVTAKDHKHLPVPYSWLQWSNTPLFLQNNIFLI